ncbi:hypothetical protein GCM10011415_17860 [Salipiger pallidus]|uniref:DUF805 domain-containing protein n=1 Tax=Salipiger pallidus TaxID=1775170 RepID=A0A8J3EGD1_9RHOB|nr:hypothetical protein GCM10011415_17860 [Salipiger pallidus]
MLIPNLAVGARRLHDIDRSGWWRLLTLLPVIGLLVLIAFITQKGPFGSTRQPPRPDRGGNRGAPQTQRPALDHISASRLSPAEISHSPGLASACSRVTVPSSTTIA